VFLGGVLNEYASWPWLFFISLRWRPFRDPSRASVMQRG